MNKLAAILLLWLPFSVTSVLAVPIALFAIAVEENVYAKDVLRAMDKLAAAVAVCTFYGAANNARALFNVRLRG